RGAILTDGALDSLRNLCNGTINCKYIANPIIMPPGLQCGAVNACISCDRIAEVYSQFLSDYPNEQLLANDTLRYQYDTLMTGYFNRKLGYKKSASEYYAFLTTCKIPFYNAVATAPILQGPLLAFPLTGTASIAGVRCDTMQNIINDFRNTYTNLASWNMVTIRRKKVLKPVLEYALGCNGILKTSPSYRIVAPQTWDGAALRDSGFASRWYRNKMTFIKFDFWPLPRKLNVDSTNVKLSPVLSGRFNPNVYYGQMTSVWDTTLQCSQLGTAIWGYKLPTYTHLYQYNTSLNNPIYVLDFKLPYKTYIKTPAIYQGNVLAAYLVPATDSLVSQTFIGSANPLALTDPETAPHLDVVYRTDTIYGCKDLFTAFVNARLNTRLSYTSIDSLYQQKCGAALPVICLPDSGTGLLCSANIMPDIPYVLNKETPCDDSLRFAIVRGTDLFTVYRDSILNVFAAKYTAKCLQAINNEQFTVVEPISEYHYTLYYYDQAGNLLKTVPPKGVKPNFNNVWLQSIADARTNGTVIKPAHELVTNYRYNGLNQVVSQRSPDGGRSEFWYDRLARLVVSQNAKQKAEGNNYSYTKYDLLGRINEVGQISGNVTLLNDSITRRANLLNNWFTTNNTKREQITSTYYDQATINLGVYMTQNKATLRNRVSYSSFTKGNNPVNYDNGSFYNYDIHGNVKELVQDYGSASMMGLASNQYKKIAYEYDLISGKVNKVVYQPAYFVPATQNWVIPTDAFYHRYKYDAENRITEVYTSADGVNWDHDGHYEYYKHGPLARMQLGENQVQGMDYVYALQGWLKGVNGTVLDSTQDAGQDGNPLNVNRKLIPKDELGYSLHYFDNDYTAINAVNAFAGLTPQLKNNSAYKPLYNGNISSMAVNISKLNQPVLYNYQYDQLNRLKGMDMFKGNNTAPNLWSSGLTGTADYQEMIQYDANGNITNYLRNGWGTKQTMDSLSYKYIAGKNQLEFVRDQVNGSSTHNSNYTEDIDDQLAGNYKYDSIGNLIYDRAAGIDLIKWDVYGKILEIQKQVVPGSNYTNLKYSYDASGNRISKITTISDTVKTTWYVRDAAGNTMAVYSYDNKKTKLFADEQQVFGSSRLGIYNPQQEVNIPIQTAAIGSLGTSYLYTFIRGKKFFELNNHLGNVLVTISDKKMGHDAGNGTIDYYKANVVTANDYTPFGMQMAGRIFKASSTYRYGFNGKENDNEVKGEGNQQDYGLRIYDPRLGRFLSKDPLTMSFPWYTPYQFAGNSPLANIDLDGGEPKPATNGASEGETQSTSENRGRWTGGKNGQWANDVAVSQVWYWHAGGIGTGGVVRSSDGKSNTEKLTQAGWYTADQYFQVLKSSRASTALATNLSLYTWKPSTDAAGDQASLQKFVENGFSENGGKFLIAAAQSKAQDANFNRTGTVTPSSFNVEDLLGIGFLAKEGIAALKNMGSSLANNVAKKEINYLRRIWPGADKGQNIGTLGGVLENTPYYAVGVSGQSIQNGAVGIPVLRRFTTFEVRHTRAFDSEVKLLEDFAEKFHSTPNVRGTLTLTSERLFCPSCEGVIQQFSKMFPNIRIKLVNGIK
ncbi:MAG TPA: deaminase domain-containing protein, partial [Chitinophagaceae bacterium]|nr:deaminase domain-containing protein [Chitinophagaceae bacterium]